jgi:hypothetical protein
MRPCKRVEIVIEEAQAARLAARLESLAVPGYTMIPRARGYGDRGKRRGDDPTGTLTNCYFLVACDAATATRIVDGVHELLSQAGGLCLVSEAELSAH